MQRLLQEKVNTFVEGMRKRSASKNEVIHSLIPESKKEVEQGASLEFRKKNVTEAIITVQGDGNCYFRCISRVLYGTEERHIEVRNAVVREMERNRAKYE